MSYKRYVNKNFLTKNEKIKLLEEYNEYYKEKIQNECLDSLNTKIPREVFEEILDQIGCILISESQKFSKEGIVKDFLDENPLPLHMKNMLPDDFRAFSLLINALKQWVSAESAATDRYLLGGKARDLCRSATTKCIVTNELIGSDAELHHPMRDGRPPILLSKDGHTQVEQNNQNTNAGNVSNETWDIIKSLRTKKHMSWVQLREGCIAIITGSKKYRPGAKSFANSVIRETKLDANEIIELLDSMKV